MRTGHAFKNAPGGLSVPSTNLEIKKTSFRAAWAACVTGMPGREEVGRAWKARLAAAGGARGLDGTPRAQRGRPLSPCPGAPQPGRAGGKVLPSKPQAWPPSRPCRSVARDLHLSAQWRGAEALSRVGEP